MQSIIQLLGVPREFGITLLALTLAFALMPYLAGYDFGIVRLPMVEERKAKLLRRLGPFLFALAMAMHLPVIKSPTPEAKSLAVVPFSTAQLSPRQLAYAKALTARVTTALQADSTLTLVSPRSARLLAEREHSARIAVELNVAHIVEGDIAISEGGAVQLWLTIVRGETGRAVLAKEFCVTGPDPDTMSQLTTQLSDAIRSHVVGATSKQIIASGDASPSSTCEDSVREESGRASIILSFQGETSALAQRGRTALEGLAGAMKNQQLSDVDFTISAHVLPSGDPRSDYRISEARALVVKATLVELGVESHRIAARGRGSTEPLNKDNPNAPENRRITIHASKR